MSPSLDFARVARLLREGGWVAVGQAASMLGALVLVRVLTESLDPAQYGQIALGLTVALLVNQVVMGGVNNGIGRFYSIALEQDALPDYLGASRRLMDFAVLTVFGIGIVLLAVLWMAGLTHWMGLTLAILLFSILTGCNATLVSIQNAARQRLVVAIHGGAEAWLKILLVGWAVILLGRSSTAVIIGFAASTFVVMCSQALFLRNQIPGGSKAEPRGDEWFTKMWMFSWPFSVWGIFSWIQQSANRWALEWFRSTEDVGLFSVLYQIGFTPLSLLVGLLIVFLGPILFQRAGNSTDSSRTAEVDRIIWRLAGTGLAFTGIAFILTWWLHSWIFGLLVASKYRHVSHLLAWMVLAGGLLGIAQILNQKIFCDLSTRRMILPGVVTPLISLGASLAGAHWYGVKGVVAANLLYAALNLAWIALIVRHGSRGGGP